jgi:hypothetical protein
MKSRIFSIHCPILIYYKAERGFHARNLSFTCDGLRHSSDHARDDNLAVVMVFGYPCFPSKHLYCPPLGNPPLGKVDTLASPTTKESYH